MPMSEELSGRSDGPILGLCSLVFVLYSTLLVPSLLGQSSAAGALMGILKDASGMAVANGTITLTDSGAQSVRTTITGPDGSYKFELLPPGTYRVTFQSGGLVAIETSSIEIHAAEIRT